MLLCTLRNGWVRVDMTIANVDEAEMPDENALSAADLRQLMNGLLSGLSHDLRTPLSTINGWLFVLESDQLDATTKKRALDKMRANIDEQVRLIDDVLLLSRSMTGHLVVDSAQISPLATLSLVMENLRAVAAAASVSLPAAIVNESAEVMADGQLLRRVFEILFLHALKTTPAGGAIATTLATREAHVEITITDNGKGVSPTEIPTLFDAFRRVENKFGSAYPGAERNLMLAKTLVERLHGQLHASSRGPGLGTTFTLRMPAVNAGMAAASGHTGRTIK